MFLLIFLEELLELQFKGWPAFFVGLLEIVLSNLSFLSQLCILVFLDVGCGCPDKINASLGEQMCAFRWHIAAIIFGQFLVRHHLSEQAFLMLNFPAYHHRVSLLHCRVLSSKWSDCRKISILTRLLRRRRLIDKRIFGLVAELVFLHEFGRSIVESVVDCIVSREEIGRLEIFQIFCWSSSEHCGGQQRRTLTAKDTF